MEDYWSTEIGSLTRLVYDCKNEIVSSIENNVHIKPKFIFCHSGEQEKYSKTYPRYYVFYANARELNQSIIDQDTILKLCHDILMKNDQSGFYKPGTVEIEFRDAEKDKAQLYGFARED